jgi:hypothetical protein
MGIFPPFAPCERICRGVQAADMVPSWGGIYLDNVKVFHQIKAHEAYQALPRKVSNQVLIQLHKAWVAFFEAMEAWKKHPEQFIGRPKLPGYKHKTAGRNLLVYEKDAIWKRELDRGVIAVSGLGELIQTKQTRKTVNKADFIPRLVNGRPVMTPVGCSLGLLGVEPHACEIGMRMVEPALGILALRSHGSSTSLLVSGGEKWKPIGPRPSAQAAQAVGQARVALVRAFGTLLARHPDFPLS